jgi:hypothetical protein
MASTDARPVPRKNVAFRAYFPIYKTDGSLVSGAAGLDSEVSKDGGAFADATAEATEIGSSGVYYLELSSTEMNADSVVVVVKTSTTDAIDPVLTLYPEEAGDIRSNVTQINSDAALFAKFAAAVGTSQVGTVFDNGGAQTNSATVIWSDDIVDATADLYNGRFVIVLTGTYAKKATKVTDYERSGGYGKFTVESMGAALADNDTFLVL